MAAIPDRVIRCGGAIRFLLVAPRRREVRVLRRERMAHTRNAGSLSDIQARPLVEHRVLRVARGTYARWPLGAGWTDAAAGPGLDPAASGRLELAGVQGLPGGAE